MAESKCPKCESVEIKPLKSWLLKPRKAYAQTKRINHAVQVTLNLCQNCGQKFRTYRKQE